MENRNEAIGELLLSRLPQATNLDAYQEQVKSLLAENEKKLRRDKKTIVRMWIFVAVVSAPCLVMAGGYYGTPQGNWFLGFTYFWVLLGAVEVLKYVVQQGRVELLRELKQTQLQVLELNALLNKSVRPMSETP